MREVLTALVVILFASLRIAQEYQRAVVFRLGRYVGTRGPGLYFLILFFEWKRLIDIRTVSVDVERQEPITKDSVTIKVNAVVWFRITEPDRAVIKVADFRSAIYQLSSTTLRNIIGQHMPDEAPKDLNKINDTRQKIIHKVIDPWGVKVEMVEMKDVEIPESMQRAMAREAEASREKRARLIKAEAEEESPIRLASASNADDIESRGLAEYYYDHHDAVGFRNPCGEYVFIP